MYAAQPCTAAQAKEACQAEGLSGDWLKACAHDTAFSGDEAFIMSTQTDRDAYEATKKDIEGAAGSSGARVAYFTACTMLACFALALFNV